MKIKSYTNLEKISKGGFGTVYKAEHTTLGRTDAIKVFNSTEVNWPREEGRSLAALKHPNIVQVYHIDLEAETPYMAMEYIEGETLRDIMKREHSLFEVVNALTETAKAIAHAHSKGIIHKDIKPENILISKEGTTKVCDFGLSEKPESLEHSLGSSKGILGSINYMSPEQRLGKKTDEKTDSYSMAAILYEGATGEPPIGTIRKTELSEIIERNLSPKPEERNTAKELAETLERIRQDPTCLKTGLIQASKITKEKTSKVKEYLQNPNGKQELEEDIEGLAPLLKGLEQAVYNFKGDAAAIKTELEELKKGQKELYAAATEGNVSINLPGGLLSYTPASRSIISRFFNYDLFSFLRNAKTEKEMQENHASPLNKQKLNFNWRKKAILIPFVGLVSIIITTNSALKLIDRFKTHKPLKPAYESTFLGAKGIRADYEVNGKWTSEKPENVEGIRARLTFDRYAARLPSERQIMIKEAKDVEGLAAIILRSEHGDVLRGTVPKPGKVTYLETAKIIYIITSNIAKLHGSPNELTYEELREAEKRGYDKGFFAETRSTKNESVEKKNPH